MNPPPRLACQQCKSRKTKCDKGAPCSACRSASLSCHAVQRARLPRGKTAKGLTPNKDLAARVARIESLLEQQPKQLGSQSLTLDQLSIPDNLENHKPVGVASEKITDFVASDFWRALSTEVYGLREALEDESAEDGANPYDVELTDEPAGNTCSAKMILFPRSSKSNVNAYDGPPSDIREKLLDLYRSRVDSVYKITHWPTALSIIQLNHMRPRNASLSLPARILECSIYFMSLCTITDVEAKEMGLGVKSDILRHFRSTVEESLVESNLLQSPDFVTLQAFVIYLVGLRTCLSGAYTWTLVAVAVRAATALRLGEEDPRDFSPFDLQLRRRLFFAIGILDTHSALDRGTIPILPSTSFRTPPLNINDDDMHPADKSLKSSWPNPTDMSHTAMIYEAMICQRRLYEISNGAQNGWEQWSKKVELLMEFETSIVSNHTNISGCISPLRTLRRMSAKKIAVSMQLLARRPPYQQPHNTVPPWDDFDIMNSATQVLEQHLQPMPVELQPWAWKNWVQWHALAVLLAELLVRPQDASSDRGYAIATQSFRHYARLVADLESGLLWKPIAKLMRRVQRLRQTSNTTANKTSSSGTEATYTVPILVDQTGSATFNDELLGLPDWDINIDTFDTTTLNIGDHVEPQYNGSGYGNEAPWLTWDYFVRDINYSPP